MLPERRRYGVIHLPLCCALKQFFFRLIFISGAFLVPYFICLVVVGLPLFLLELSFGQYASEGPITIWKISPLFQGLGYAMFCMSALVGVYYNMILAWALFYLLSSFTTKLPWSSCGELEISSITESYIMSGSSIICKVPF